jgi:ubiquinone/menaquinone biosynthesis C-methylase UbiE
MASLSAQAAYDAAADLYDSQVCGFWDRHGRATIERLGLAPGARVLDACCGTGASALAAARVVGDSGEVVGVDVAARLLEVAQTKAEAQGLRNVSFVHADALEFEDPAGFDAVVCVFGIFQMPDMSAAMRKLWSLVRPGGRLAITTWAESCLEPGATAFWDAVREVRADLYKAFNPWDAITRPETVTELYESAGISRSRAERVVDAQPLEQPTDWWTIVMGTGFRGTMDALEPPEAALVRDACLAAMEGVHQVNTSAIYAVARKPG